MLLVMIPTSFAFNSDYKRTTHHDYNISITTRDGSYNSALLKISIRLKHPGASANVVLKHEVWTSSFEDSASRANAQNFMDEYGEVSRNYTVPLSEILQPYSARDYPYGLFIIEVTDGHTTHPYIIGYKRDIRRITFRGMQLYCNVGKYWGNWEYELTSDRDKPEHCN
ncbi:MAG: hypothetical protein AMJ56_07690 [Anaerolineae bacterium SG8_19]|nr:MAG: hypothetical protein AMJ56_07690 [Anaerolineae bacterium SG8_19]